MTGVTERLLEIGDIVEIIEDWEAPTKNSKRERRCQIPHARGKMPIFVRPLLEAHKAFWLRLAEDWSKLGSRCQSRSIQSFKTDTSRRPVSAVTHAGARHAELAGKNSMQATFGSRASKTTDRGVVSNRRFRADGLN
jgi:hypothetical protein